VLTAPANCVTPPELAKRWRAKPETIIALIRSGALRAFTLSPAGSSRPRWKISADAVVEYENRHAAKPPAATPPRRRKAVDVIEFY